MITPGKTILIARHSEGMELVAVDVTKMTAVSLEKKHLGVVVEDIMKKTGEIATFTAVYKHKKGKLYAHFGDVIYNGVKHCVYYRLIDHTWWIRPHHMFHGLDEDGVKRFTFEYTPIGANIND